MAGQPHLSPAISIRQGKGGLSRILSLAAERGAGKRRLLYSALQEYQISA